MGYGLLVRCPAPSPECEIREHGGLCFSRRMFWTDACVKRPTSPHHHHHHQIHSSSPNPTAMALGDGAFGNRFGLGHEGGVPVVGLAPFKEETRELAPSLSLPWERMQPSAGRPSGTKGASTLNLDSQPPEL